MPKIAKIYFKIAFIIFFGDKRFKMINRIRIFLDFTTILQINDNSLD